MVSVLFSYLLFAPLLGAVLLLENPELATLLKSSVPYQLALLRLALGSGLLGNL